ncbi:Tn3 family transposase [Streptomyces europaeiscabiei]|nr:Tn3 family transposase [Streptomyces europaeiscabiei]
MTAWHQRYRGPGVMIHWHVERKSVCIYSQLKSCSASEVASMIGCPAALHRHGGGPAVHRHPRRVHRRFRLRPHARRRLPGPLAG